jgi:hypothetical protein
MRRQSSPRYAARACLLLLLSIGVPLAGAEKSGPARSPGDWPEWGGSSLRNNVSDAKDLPHEWDPGRFDFRTGQWQGESAQHIKWVARLGSESYGSPVISGGKLFCATNNGGGYLERYPADVDLGCLLAFSQADGTFLWQHSAE